MARAQRRGPARYAPAKIVEAVPTVVNGQPDPAHISIERQNLTIRMVCRPFTCLTHTFSTKLEKLKAAPAPHFAHDNYVRIHGSLRVAPVMAADVTDRVWEFSEWVALGGRMTPDTGTDRNWLLRRGVWLAWATVGWNAIEGIIALSAGALASSIALIGFGVDSFVETASGAVVGWRLRAELTGQADHEPAEALEHRAGRIAGALLLTLAAYIIIDAGRRLLGYGAETHESTVGIVLTAISLVVMPLLGWAKLRTAVALGSGALRADAYETVTCSWLSLTTLVGLILNATLEWWWADPLAALVIVPLAIREGLEGWRGECHTES